jgi:hypothetical protein
MSIVRIASLFGVTLRCSCFRAEEIASDITRSVRQIEIVSI